MGGLTDTSGACGYGIYLAAHAGICRNTSVSRPVSGSKKYEFTTIRYGSCQGRPGQGEKEFDLHKCGFLICLVMNPGECEVQIQHQNPILARKTVGWLKGRSVLTIKLVSIETLPFAEMILKWNRRGFPEHQLGPYSRSDKTEKTRMHKQIGKIRKRFGGRRG